MKICPQCNSVFGDDYVFCLNDGNTLRDESGEQQTLLASRVRMPIAVEQESTVDCGACGLSNRANSRFCKKCGAPLGRQSDAWSRSSGSGYDSPPEQTIAFQSPVFSPPNAGTAPSAASGNRNLLIGLGLLAVFVLGGAIIYSKQGDTASNNTSMNTKASNTTNTVANAVNTQPAYTSNPNDPRIGKSGSLLFDSNLRAYPNRHSQKLGTHYRGARIQVLETADIRIEGGGISTWFRVRVLSYGVSMDSNNYGLDRDPGTPDEGWVNSYPEVWDVDTRQYVRRELVAFE
jgi:hypothetical protein